MGAHEQIPEGPKVGAILEFLDENVSAVDFSGNVFYLECEALLLSFADKIFSEIEMFEDFFLGPVKACAAVVVHNGG